MKDKYFRFFIIENQFKLRIIIILVLIGISLAFQNQLKNMNVKLKQVSKEKELVQKIDEMEKISNHLIKKALVKRDPSEFKLGGTTNQNGTYYAIINGDVFKQGDNISNFVVAKIAMGEAVLENRTTLERRNLYLWEESVVK